MSKKSIFEPDYRRQGWNQVKSESRSCFAFAALIALVPIIVVFFLTNQTSTLLIPATVLAGITYIALSFCARLYMQNKVDTILASKETRFC